MAWIFIPVLSRGKAIPIAAACCASSNFDRKLQEDEGLENHLFCFCYFEGGGVTHTQPRPCRGEEARIMIKMDLNSSLSRQLLSSAVLC